MGTVFAVTGALGAATVRSARAAVGRRWSAGRRRSAPAGGRPGRWQVVTVDRSPPEVLPEGAWPEPLRRLDGAVEVALRRAPGGRGTELAARPLPHAAWPGLAAHLLGDDPALLVRRTLWQVKQLTEAGELLRADRPPGDRRAVPPAGTPPPPTDRPPR
ncbi:hypothetical protein [Micromonospora sp. WMMD1082]|uniref:hypothetical protein n=1 Tax=Micromonospora sp. WMMD1082 TaxID=3016104 RepID=UPI002417C222|nr:hypothetical protein [Micromonospora sp. WMMD1082]MDG4796336.1 hypothetical protein [Micromonospora sp. WMMD1082]